MAYALKIALSEFIVVGHKIKAHDEAELGINVLTYK